MHKYYVYLNMEQHMLGISEKEINDERFVELHQCEGDCLADLKNLCNFFCLGYLLGNKEGAARVRNRKEDFQISLN